MFSNLQLPAILFTPICPHSLSFRPVVLPQTVVLTVRTTDHPASVAFDGRHRSELKPGDSLNISVSRYPFPCKRRRHKDMIDFWVNETFFFFLWIAITKTSQTAEWFQSISRHLNWNRRTKQKAKSSEDENNNNNNNNLNNNQHSNNNNANQRSFLTHSMG